jgi:DNA recombination protein RmuC
MASQLLLLVLVVLHAVTIALLIQVLRRRSVVDLSPMQGRLEGLDKAQERTERALRDEIARNRDESGQHSRELRQEVSTSLKTIGDSTLQNLGELSRVQSERLADVFAHLGQLTETHQLGASQLREEVNTSVRHLNNSVLQSMTELATVQKGQMEGFATQLGALTTSNETRLDALRTTVETKLQVIREDITRQLEQVRQTVDEKLQGALEKRLGESFQLVSERLEQVHKGLGEMQTLASGVGDLKKVLTNVKVRGNWGEVQLGNLLEQVLTPDQYATNVATRDHGGERVEFAVKLPGRGEGDEPVWLPIDAKFPQEDYARLVEAQERGDGDAAEAASRALEMRVRGCAKDICDKYLAPPRTTDFGILFLPTEGLYAEVLRRTGLVELLHRECRVIIAGPTTLFAILNSLQMGFRTLAIQKRSSEVWTVLGAVKTEFGKFGGVLEKVQKKLQEASSQMDNVAVRTRAIDRNLRKVQELPTAEAANLLIPADAVTLGQLGTEQNSNEWSEAVIA